MGLLRKYSNWFYIGVVALFAIGIYAGLADLDYYWQVKLGEQELLNHDFNYSYKLVWGEKGLGEYLDHEWLCNIVFYLFSLLPYRAIAVLKGAVSLLSGVCFAWFIKKHDRGLSLIQMALLYLILGINALVFVKVKAYTISSLFLLVEIVLLEKYKESKNKRLFFGMFGLCVLWVNFHSGSVPLYFVVAGVYWLCCFRGVRELCYGVGCALGTLLNPYGWSLMVFNLRHNGDTVMKSLIMDWRPVDAKEALGVVAVLVFLVWAISLLRKRSVDWEIIILSALTFFLTLQSVRHIIYFIPFVVVLICNTDLPCKLETKLVGYPVLALVLLAVLEWLTVLWWSPYGEEYCMNHMPDELKEVLIQTNVDGSDGLFSDYTVSNLIDLGLQPFVFGGYPLCPDRTQDGLIMTQYGGVDNIGRVIDYYDLSRFVFVKYNTKVDFYLVTSPLYDYLMNNDKYVKLYDDELVVYFVERGLE